MSFSYPKNIRFRCSNCALCCRDTKEKKRRILLLKIEAKRISKNTLMNIDDFAEKIEGSEPYGYVMKKLMMENASFLRTNHARYTR